MVDPKALDISKLGDQLSKVLTEIREKIAYEEEKLILATLNDEVLFKEFMKAFYLLQVTVRGPEMTKNIIRKSDGKVLVQYTTNIITGEVEKVA